MPKANIKVDGLIIQWSYYENEKNSIEIVTPKQDFYLEKWLYQLYVEHVNPALFRTHEIIISKTYTPEFKGKESFSPPTYTINIKGINEPVIKLKITSDIIIENGPWRTDLSYIQ